MFKKCLMKSLFITTLIISFSTFAAVTKTDVNDAAITAAVKAKLLSDRMVSGFDIKVETNGGIVTLQGAVKTSTEAEKAIEIAYSTKDVRDVDSKLSVLGSKHPIADAMITAKVRGMFVREKLFGEEPTAVTGIHIETNDGIVYLSGNVPSQAKVDTAIKLAKAVNGVKEVKSSIEVR